MRNALTTSVLLVISLYCQSQGLLQPVGSRYAAITAYSGRFADVFASRNNVASLASLRQSAVGAYAEKRFMLEDLNLFAASGALVTRSGNFGLHVGHLGGAGQSTTQLSLNYGRRITKLVDIGAGFHYHQLTQPSYYGNANAITASFGMLLHLNEKVHAGFSAYNPFRASWSNNKEERLPARYGFGLGYDASEKVFVGAELVKEENVPIDVQLSMQYVIIPQLFFRGGFTTLGSGYFAGLGWQMSSFRMDIATSYHQQLGFTPGVLLLVNLGKVKDTDSNSK